MKTQWDKLINVVDQTNDKVIFFSENRSYVVMSLDQYTAAFRAGNDKSALTEEQLIDKINRDIAVWKTQTASEHEDELADSVASQSESSQADADDFHIEPVNI